MSKGAVIAAWLKAKITDGTYQAGTKLPRRENIASKFGCSTGPVSMALGQLEVGGWIRREAAAMLGAARTALVKWDSESILKPDFCVEHGGRRYRRYGRARIEAIIPLLHGRQN